MSPEQEHFLRASNKISEKTQSRSAEVNKVAKRKGGAGCELTHKWRREQERREERFLTAEVRGQM